MNLLGHTRGKQELSAPITLPLTYPAAQPHPALLLLFIMAIPHFLCASQKLEMGGLRRKPKIL